MELYIFGKNKEKSQFYRIYRYIDAPKDKTDILDRTYTLEHSKFFIKKSSNYKRKACGNTGSH